MNTRVVIADDCQMYRELLLVLLGQVPHIEIVGIAGDGREAVRIAVEREADVALLDVDMPLLDGLEAAAEIRRPRPQTELVLHSGMLVDDRRRRAELTLDLFDKLHLPRTLDMLAGFGERRAA
jgi:DNA-binding NarL/FixJ family response regulator